MQQDQAPPTALRHVDRWLIPAIFVLGVFLSFRMHTGTKMGHVIWSDGEGYYIYLPATFIYGGWDAFDKKKGDGLHAIACCAISPDKRVQTRYTYGIAALQAPFFLAAHGWASWFHGSGTPPPADHATRADNGWAQEIIDRKWTELRGQATGFSDIYARGVLVGAVFYLCLGLFFVKETLKRWFPLPTVLMTTALLFFATNLYYYSVSESSMSHVYSFFLFAAFLYFLPGFFDRPRIGNTIGIGAALSFIFLIRPTNIVIALLLFGFEVYSRHDLRLRFRELIGRYKDFLLMALVFLVLLIPQMLYWKSAFGSWVSWSYGDEGFSNWYKPHLPHVLFSHQNGLFMYTPIMLLAMGGIWYSLRKRMLSGYAVLVVFALATYTFASWWAWWFGGAFGHRCYVEFYALLAWPLAWVVLQFQQHRVPWKRFLLLGLLLAFVYANLKMTYLYAPPWDGPDWTWSRYFAVLKELFRFWTFPI